MCTNKLNLEPTTLHFTRGDLLLFSISILFLLQMQSVFLAQTLNSLFGVVDHHLENNILCYTQ